MAKISSDDDSWKAGGVRRRDFRNAHEEPEVPRKTKAKKDTRRWCRGKEGREHVAVDKTVPYLSDYTCCSPERQRHFTWNHRYDVRCVNCGMDSWRLPERVRAQVDPKLAKRLELEDKWCVDEGHLYDWEHNFTDPPPSPGRDQWMSTLRGSRFWEYQFCVMCGKRGKIKRRQSRERRV